MQKTTVYINNVSSCTYVGALPFYSFHMCVYEFMHRLICMYISVHIYTYVCMDVCTYVRASYVLMYNACTYVRRYLFTFVYMYVRMYVYFVL